MTRQAEKILYNRLQKYENVTKNFQRFFNVDNMFLQFDSKAEMRDVERLVAKHATKEDLRRLDQVVEAVYHRLKHLSVLQSELAKSVLPLKPSGSFNATEQANTKLQRRDFVAKQTEISANWILYTPLLFDEQGCPVYTAAVEKKDIKFDISKRLADVKRRYSQSVLLENEILREASQRTSNFGNQICEDGQDRTVESVSVAHESKDVVNHGADELKIPVAVDKKDKSQAGIKGSRSRIHQDHRPSRDIPLETVQASPRSVAKSGGSAGT